jgi:tetratricopeptide (TPR) repeat protein
MTKTKLFILFILFLAILSSPLWGMAPLQKKQRYLDRGDRELLSQHYDRAIANYLKGILYAPWQEKVEVWDDLGFAYLQKREIKKAISYLIQSISVHPKDFNPQFYLALAYIHDNEIELAFEQLRTIDENIQFDSNWMKKAPELLLQKPCGKSVDLEELERIKTVKGVFLEEKSPGTIIIHLDAFNEKNEAAFYFAHGVVLKNKGDFAASENKLFKALKAGYNEWEVRLHLADLYQRHNMEDKAEEQLKKISAQTPKFPVPLPFEFKIHHRLSPPNYQLMESIHTRAWKELERGKIDGAIKLLEEALDASPKSFLINHNLALLYFDTGKPEKAAQYCGRAIWFLGYSISKEHRIGCHDLMGNILYHQKKFSNALQEFTAILKIDELNAAGHYNLGSVHYALGHSEDAEKEWQKAIDCEGIAQRLKDEKGTSETATKISVTVRKKSISFLSHVSLGQMYLDQNLTGKAVEEFDFAILLKPNDPLPYLKMAQISEIQGEIRKANYYLEKYLYLGGKRTDKVEKLIDSLKKRK